MYKTETSIFQLRRVPYIPQNLINFGPQKANTLTAWRGQPSLELPRVAICL